MYTYILIKSNAKVLAYLLNQRKKESISVQLFLSLGWKCDLIKPSQIEKYFLSCSGNQTEIGLSLYTDYRHSLYPTKNIYYSLLRLHFSIWELSIAPII